MRPTQDHMKIQQWANKHDAAPAEIKPLVFDGQPSILYFLFGKARTGTPEISPITWEDFFARFDLLQLSMVWHDDGPIFELLLPNKDSGSYIDMRDAN
jgi:hypothetical protein